MGLHTITFTLVIIGALNWGLAALGFNVVEMILGFSPALIQVVYLLVGASAIYEIATHATRCKECEKMMKSK